MGEMQPLSDAQLLRDYAERGAEAAFAEIVARHTDLVYSAVSLAFRSGRRKRIDPFRQHPRLQLEIDIDDR